MLRDFYEAYDMINQLKHPEKLYEKEYYFDEGLGESVQEHVNSIKEKLPDLEVSVRRDRDGYPIIKTKFKPQYKYNLDTLSKLDPKGEMNNIKESMESLIKHILPEGGAAALTKLDKGQLEQTLLMMQKGEG
jgi:hypothetical protein